MGPAARSVMLWHKKGGPPGVELRSKAASAWFHGVLTTPPRGFCRPPKYPAIRTQLWGESFVCGVSSLRVAEFVVDSGVGDLAMTARSRNRQPFGIEYNRIRAFHQLCWNDLCECELWCVGTDIGQVGEGDKLRLRRRDPLTDIPLGHFLT